MRATKIDPKKKPVKYFVPIFTGILEYLERGLISWSQFGLYVGIHLQADYSTGLWLGSAPRLLNSGQRGAKLREIQRDLDRLVQVGLLKHFHRQGTRGNFPWILNKFICRSGALTGMRLNAEKSTSLQSLCYEPCADDALTTRSFCADDGGLPSHLQEVKNLEVKESNKKEKRGSTATAPGNTKPLSPETQKLLTQLEQELSDQLSGRGWWRKDQTEPQLHGIREWFEIEARDQGIDFRQIGDLYVETMAKVKKNLEPTERVGPGAITLAMLDAYAAEAGSDTDAQEVIRDDGSLIVISSGGITEYYLGHNEPYWHPFEDVTEQPPLERAIA